MPFLIGAVERDFDVRRIDGNIMRTDAILLGSAAQHTVNRSHAEAFRELSDMREPSGQCDPIKGPAPQMRGGKTLPWWRGFRLAIHGQVSSMGDYRPIEIKRDQRVRVSNIAQMRVAPGITACGVEGPPDLVPK
jgi:hypothetical protein